MLKTFNLKIACFDFGALSPKWDIFIKPLSSRLRDLCREEAKRLSEEEIMDDSKNQCLPDTTILIHVTSQRL